jgi:hypothetical protein
MTTRHDERDLYLDANGVLTERVNLDGQEVIVHYDDIPESDITELNGMRMTTALRTVIDVAVETGTDWLRIAVPDCLERGLFTVDEAVTRCTQPDLVRHPGARMLRGMLQEMR